MNDPFRQAHDEFIKRAVDQGKLLEAGFLALRLQILPNAPDHAVNTARMLYMAGAQHLFASLMAAMDPDRDPTPQDMRRMALIAGELEAFEPQLKAWATGPKTGTVQ